MDERVMVKMEAGEGCVILRTISRKRRSPQRFIMLKKELGELEEKKRVILRDIHSFADIRLYKSAQGRDTLEITFFWLSDSGFGDVKGWSQRVILRYEDFLACLENSRQSGGKGQRLLSIEEYCRHKIEFKSFANLKEVAKVPLLRKKLGHFLAGNFNWTGYERIVITDDFVPYSFYFIGYTPYGKGICGGIILHGQENLRKAYYGMHT